VISILDLVYCGHVLRDDVSLTSCGISDGSHVFALKKRRLLEPNPKAGTGVFYLLLLCCFTKLIVFVSK